LVDAAAGVEKYVAVAVLLDVLVDAAVERLDHLPVHLGRDLRPGLHAQVVTHLNDLDVIHLS